MRQRNALRLRRRHRGAERPESGGEHKTPADRARTDSPNQRMHQRNSTHISRAEIDSKTAVHEDSINSDGDDRSTPCTTGQLPDGQCARFKTPSTPLPELGLDPRSFYGRFAHVKRSFLHRDDGRDGRNETLLRKFPLPKPPPCAGEGVREVRGGEETPRHELRSARDEEAALRTLFIIGRRPLHPGCGVEGVLNLAHCPSGS